MTSEVREHRADGSGGTSACDGAAAATAAPTSCQAELGWGLSTINRAFGQRAAASLNDLPGGPRGHLVLATISRGRPASQLALANELGLDRTVMTYLLDELEHAGLLERRPDPDDRRARQVLITAAGSKAAIEYRARLSAAEQQLLTPLDEHESLLFRSFIERIAQAVQASSGQPSAIEPCSGETC